jgi:nitroreductase
MAGARRRAKKQGILFTFIILSDVADRLQDAGILPQMALGERIAALRNLRRRFSNPIAVATPYPRSVLPMTLTAQETHEKKKAPHVDGVLPIFHERWSPRSFSSRPVTRETLARIFEAARWAASSYNEQPWRFIVGERGSETYRRIFDSLGEFNQKWTVHAPILILGVALTNFSHNGAPNRFAVYDLGAAASYMTLEAAALGVATHQMAGFDENKARELLGIPAEFAIGSVIAMGYQDDPAKLGDPQLIERETSPRERKPLGEIVLEAWGRPMKLD